MIQFPLSGRIALMLAVVSLSACQGAREMHYFKQGDNYYRVRIREKALFTSSRYQSGFFDDAAVDNYFSEIRQPKSVAIQRKTQAVQRIEPDGSIHPPEQTKFVIILSSNSKAISDQIGGLAENEQIFALLSKMANKTTNNALSGIANTVAGPVGNTASRVAQRVDDLAFPGTGPVDTTRLLSIINSVMEVRHPDVKPFKTAAEAIYWYQNIQK